VENSNILKFFTLLDLAAAKLGENSELVFRWKVRKWKKLKIVCEHLLSGQWRGKQEQFLGVDHRIYTDENLGQCRLRLLWGYGLSTGFWWDIKPGM